MIDLRTDQSGPRFGWRAMARAGEVGERQSPHRVSAIDPNESRSEVRQELAPRQVVLHESDEALVRRSVEERRPPGDDFARDGGHGSLARFGNAGFEDVDRFVERCFCGWIVVVRPAVPKAGGRELRWAGARRPREVGSQARLQARQYVDRVMGVGDPTVGDGASHPIDRRSEGRGYGVKCVPQSPKGLTEAPDVARGGRDLIGALLRGEAGRNHLVRESLSFDENRDAENLDPRVTDQQDLLAEQWRPMAASVVRGQATGELDADPSQMRMAFDELRRVEDPFDVGRPREGPKEEPTSVLANRTSVGDDRDMVATEQVGGLFCYRSFECIASGGRERSARDELQERGFVLRTARFDQPRARGSAQTSRDRVLPNSPARAGAGARRGRRALDDRGRLAMVRVPGHSAFDPQASAPGEALAARFLLKLVEGAIDHRDLGRRKRTGAFEKLHRKACPQR